MENEKIITVAGTFGVKDYVDASGRCVMRRTPNLRFVCCVCDRGFGKKKPCIEHLLVTHKIEVKEIRRSLARDQKNVTVESNKCLQCDKVFSKSRNLIIHLKLTHGQDVIPETVQMTKRIECPLCAQSFGAVSTVNRHIRRCHRGVTDPGAHQTSIFPTVPCHFCEMKFSLESKWKSHMSSYHHAILKTSPQRDGDSLVNVYGCTLCDTDITSQSEFKIHLLFAHEREVNEFCIEIASELESSTTPKQTFDCEECNVFFKEEELWRSHMKTQHNAFPESCCWMCGDHSCKTVFELQCHLKEAHFITYPGENRETVPLRFGMKDLGLSASEFRAMRRIPEWLVKHGGNQLLVVLNTSYLKAVD